MKTTPLVTTLTNIGLSEHEAKVYLAGLSLGPTTVLKLARSAELKRTTVYTIIDELKKRGLMNIEVRGFKKLYTVEDPRRLELVLEEQKERFKNELPEFLALYNLKGEEGTIKYYEGLEAIKSIYSGFLSELKPHDDYLVIANQEKWFNLDPKFFMKYKEDRAKKNVRTRMLFQDSPVAREHKKFEKNWNEEIKILPAGTKFNTDLVIMPNKVIFFSLDVPLIAIVIENKNIIQTQRELFELLWKTINDWSNLTYTIEVEQIKPRSYDTTLLSFLGDIHNKTILDYGAGTGVFAQTLRQQGADVHVWDVNPEMTERAIGKLGKQSVYTSLETIPNDSFDFVLCSLVFCIVEENEVRTITERIKRYLKDSGTAYIGFCNPKIFNVTETQLDFRFQTGESYEKNHTYEKIKKEGGYKIIETHRPISWYETIFRNSGLVLQETLFTPEYTLNGKHIQDFIIFKLTK